MKTTLLIITGFIILALGGLYLYSTSFPRVIRVQTDMSHKISGDDLAQAQELFQKNNIDISKISLVHFDIDRHGVTHIGARQFYKGLPLLSDDLGYHFDKNGSKLLIPEEVYTGDIAASEIPTVTMKEAAWIFYKKTSIEALNAELGFENLYAGTSNPNKNYVLVWEITPRNEVRKYPYAHINAHNGEVIRYDDGIRY